MTFGLEVTLHSSKMHWSNLKYLMQNPEIRLKAESVQRTDGIMIKYMWISKKNKAVAILPLEPKYDFWFKSYPPLMQNALVKSEIRYLIQNSEIGLKAESVQRTDGIMIKYLWIGKNNKAVAILPLEANLPFGSKIVLATILPQVPK